MNTKTQRRDIEITIIKKTKDKNDEYKATLFSDA